MLFFTRWKAAGILLTALVVCLFAVPNFFPENVIRKWPAWAQRHIVLGLDLQGGSSLLLEVDTNAVRKDRLVSLNDDVLRILRQSRILFTGRAIHGNSVEVRVTRESDVPLALEKLRELSQPLSGILGGSGQRSVQVTESGGLITLTPPDVAVIERIRQTVDQSIQIIERRVNQLGLVEPTIQRQGTDRILVQVPGLPDPSRLKELIGKTAKLDFRMLDLSETAEQAMAGQVPADSEILEGEKGQGKYLVEKRILVSGGDLIDAQPGFDQRNGEPIVSFRFNSIGARKFAEATQQNVGKPFAIILDGKVISAPVIREPILGGTGQISGNFTVEQANDLAILLRAGALPVALTVVEERTVGPGLGQDSITAGEHAAYLGAALVILFMLVTYGLFGLFANLAVAVNVAMIFGVLSMLSATLTLPGIAGIVLTVGIAVDSNVLIYERIREEVRAGRTAINAIDAGFSRALATILDSNITTFIAAAVLFFFGSGPVRGFAVTLGIGIVTTVFTAFTLTRLIVAWWVKWERPKQLAISRPPPTALPEAGERKESRNRPSEEVNARTEKAHLKETPCACFASSPTTLVSTSCASGASASPSRRRCRSRRSCCTSFTGSISASISSAAP
jgi:preprotein translocase subunit SecD